MQNYRLYFSYSTSRGRDTYGYTIVSLREAGTDRLIDRQIGGGYCMRGACLGNFIKQEFGDRLEELAPDIDNLYGLARGHNGKLYVSGSAGINSMAHILKALGYELYTYNAGKNRDMVLIDKIK